jgi:ABC-type transport system involved in multi-copper enzyme maturation permease subunit
MISATLRTITGRKGSFFGGTIFVLVIVLIVIVANIVIHELRPGRNPSMGGQTMLDGVALVLLLFGVVVAILIGSLAGSYDVAQGTMRYLVITGARRGQIYASRVAAVVLAVLLMLAAPVALGALMAVALPHTTADSITSGELADYVWTAVLWAVVFGLISMGIGSLLRSNGPAIAISLVFSIGFTPLLLLLYSVSDTLGDATLGSSLDRITGGDDGLPIAAAGVSVVLWVAAFLGAGAVRVHRDEY